MPFPFARVVLIDETPDFFTLWRFSERGEFAGETAHLSLEGAERQAVYEYGERLGDWFDIPSDQRDAEEFVLRLLGLPPGSHAPWPRPG